MNLFISSQDLQSLDLALIQQKTIVEHVHITTPPEGFLFQLDAKLKLWNVSVNQLEGVIVVTGPGSFTSSRLSVMIANSLAFRCNIPVIGIENPDRLSLKVLIENIDVTKNTDNEFVQPTYDRPPHIT